MLFFKKHIDLILSIGLILIFSFLRFTHLGYSDYLGDEREALYVTSEHVTPTDPYTFFMTLRKGPMQNLVSMATFLVSHDYKNELIHRIPFAATNLISIVVFYFLIKKLTDSRNIAFISALLFGVSGFITGFSRIVQYQNLNLLFSFFALYFYADLPTAKPFKSLFGTLFFSLSFLSHWDAVLILPVIIYFVILFIKTDSTYLFKIKVLSLHVLLGAVLILPFLIPYISYYLQNAGNQKYFDKRVGINLVFDLPRYNELIVLYAPFVANYFYLIFGLLGVLFWKRSKLFVIWFASLYIFFELSVVKADTHIYNFMIPLFVLCAFAIDYCIKKFKPISVLFILLFTFFYYQSYLLFVDHVIEYPWKQEKIYKYKTREYTYDDRPLPLFGFPLRRNWKEINQFISSQEGTFPYSTNEDKSISEYYMDAPHGTGDTYYLIGIKRPWSFMNDSAFPQVKNKKKVHEIESDTGEIVVKIYLVNR